MHLARHASQYSKLLAILAFVYAAMAGLSALDTNGQPLAPREWRLQTPRFLLQDEPGGGRRFNSFNQRKILEQAAINLTLGVGMTFVILTGGIDLSVGSILALCNVAFAVAATSLAGRIANPLTAISIAALIAVLSGTLCGVLNGWLCTWLKIPSFIVTLGTLLVLRGIAYWVSGGQTQLLSCPATLSVRIPIGVSVLAVVSAGLFLATTSLGREIYAVGGNWLAARYAGVRAGGVRIFAFACSGLCAGLAGVVYWSRTSTGSYTAGEGAELYAIAAVVLGGTRLAGGEGTIIGTFLGALIMSVLGNGLNSAGVHELTQKIIVGCVLILAAAMDSKRRTSASPDWVP